MGPGASVGIFLKKKSGDRFLVIISIFSSMNASSVWIDVLIEFN